MQDYEFRTLPVDAGLTDELRAWSKAVSLAFTQADWTDELMQKWAAQQARDGSTLLGAYPTRPLPGLPPHAPAATFSTFTKTLNTGAGHLEPAHLITDVTVRATHRRQGLLRRIMSDDLARAKRDGFALAALTVTEATIYGRFGFGPAIGWRSVELDTHRAGLTVPAGARLEIVDAATSTPLVRESFNRFHAQSRGSIDRPAFYDELLTGEWDIEAGGPNRGTRVVVSYDADDRPNGHAVWVADEKKSRVEVRDLVAVDPQTELALWAFLSSIDLLKTVAFGRFAPLSPLQWALTDQRALKFTGAGDHIWLRVLDTPKALAVRGWDADGDLTLAVTDPLGLAAGAWRLVVREGRAQTTPIDPAQATLTVDATSLASLYLGVTDARVLAAAGHVQGSAEDVAALQHLFRADVPAYCQTSF